jgi:RNA polymerase sigma-70 factor (ECF subfamily)
MAIAPERLAALRAAHPTVRFDPGVLPDCAHLDDLFLARACLAKDSGALKWLERDVMPLLRRTLLRVKASDAFVDDALQVVRERLLVGPPPRLSGYSGRGPLVAWARAFAFGTGYDLLRAEGGRTQPLDTSDEDDAAIELNASSEAADVRLIKARHQREFSAALKQAMTELTPQQRVALRMRFVDGLPREDIGAFFNVHRTTAMRWLEAAQDKLLERTRELLRERLNISPAELDSLIRYLQSGIGPSAIRPLEDTR